jgi:hypothetical protein
MTLVVDEEEEAAEWRKEAGLVRSGRLFGGPFYKLILALKPSKKLDKVRPAK